MIYVNGLGIGSVLVGLVAGFLLAGVVPKVFGTGLHYKGFGTPAIVAFTLAAVMALDFVVRLIPRGRPNRRRRRLDEMPPLLAPSAGGHISFVPVWILSFGVVVLGVVIWVEESYRLGKGERTGPTDPTTALMDSTFRVEMAETDKDCLYRVSHTLPEELKDVDLGLTYRQTAPGYGGHASVGGDSRSGKFERWQWPTWKPGEVKELAPSKTDRPRRVRLTGWVRAGGTLREVYCEFPDPK